MTRTPDGSSCALVAHRATLLRCLALVCLSLVFSGWAASQSTAPVPRNRQHAGQPSSAVPSTDELQSRLRAAAAARDAGDPVAVTATNYQVLALAFRKLANIRTTEGAFP